MTATLTSTNVKHPTFDLKQTVSDKRHIGLWRLMTGYRSGYIWATLHLGVAAAAKTATLLLLGRLIDDILPLDNRTDHLPLVALAFIALAFIEGGFTFLSGRLAAFTSEGVALRLRNYLFDHIQRLSFTYHDKNQTGDLLQRCTSDVDAIRRFFSEQGVGIGRIVMLFLINLAAIATLHWQLALASIVVIPGIVVVSIWFFQRISARYEVFQAQEARVTTRLQENLSGVRVVKAFARQDFEARKFNDENWKHYERGIELMRMHALFWPATDLITGAQLLGGYLLAATMVLDGALTVGDYLAYAGMLIWIIFPIRNLGRLVVQVSEAMVSYDRIKEVIRHDREPLGEDAPAPVTTLRGDIRFEHVSFAYDPEKPVLKDISFHVQPGQMIALMGSTGSGKTSVVSLLTRFYPNQSGTILLDGIQQTDYPRDFLRRQIGIVEQEPFLFSRSIRENITYGVGREVSDDEVIAAARAAALHHVVLSFPEGYNTIVGERGVTLSGGQKQRVAIARTLLKDPRILILDDATSSVDMETEAAIRGALKDLMPGRTSVVIAHRVQTVLTADLILVFDEGRIVQAGTHEALLQDEDGFYRRIFDMQSRIDMEIDAELERETR